MEPDLGGQEKHRRHPQRRLRLFVAMEPDLGGQEKLKKEEEGRG